MDYLEASGWKAPLPTLSATAQRPQPGEEVANHQGLFLAFSRRRERKETTSRN